eukprot:9599987-Lingulodinium_polyedra.AAC.1
MPEGKEFIWIVGLDMAEGEHCLPVAGGRISKVSVKDGMVQLAELLKHVPCCCGAVTGPGFGWDRCRFQHARVC